jgi:hypothetical protein
MIANDNHGRWLLAGERIEFLASEMGRVRVPGHTPESRRSWGKLSLNALRRIERVTRRGNDGAPAYDA